MLGTHVTSLPELQLPASGLSFFHPKLPCVHFLPYLVSPILLFKIKSLVIELIFFLRPQVSQECLKDVFAFHKPEGEKYRSKSNGYLLYNHTSCYAICLHFQPWNAIWNLKTVAFDTLGRHTKSITKLQNMKNRVNWLLKSR